MGASTVRALDGVSDTLGLALRNLGQGRGADQEAGLFRFLAERRRPGAKRAFIILDIVLSLIGSIALAVSALGIMNTMVMSILERTREIGIMKAIGGSDGGIAGVVLGWLVGRIINIGANFYIEQQGGTPGNLFSLPFWLIGGAIGFSIAISLMAGSYPAARAARLDPLQTLRHD